MGLNINIIGINKKLGLNVKIFSVVAPLNSNRVKLIQHIENLTKNDKIFLNSKFKLKSLLIKIINFPRF